MEEQMSTGTQILLVLVSIFIPFVGIIVGILWMTKKQNPIEKRKFGRLILIISIIVSILTCMCAVAVSMFGAMEYENNESQIEENIGTEEDAAEELTTEEQAIDETENETKNITEEQQPLTNLEVHFMDVGQADAIYIQQDMHHMLIDGGNNEDSDLVVDYLQNQGVQSLEYVVGTHPHEDHIGGLDRVINSFDIGSILMPKQISTTKTYEEVLLAIQNKGLKVTAPSAGMSYELGEAVITILGPVREDYEDANDHSIVLNIDFGDTSFLFMGDAEMAAERDILDLGMRSIVSDVIKVGHHGSSSSTSDALLDNVGAKIAVLTVEKDNTYGHPDQEVMERLESKGITVYRTDQNGTIIATSDGEKISFNVDPGDYSYGNTGAEKEPDYIEEVPAEQNNTETEVEAGKIEISALNKEAEVITITNNSTADVDLAGWKIVSVTGNQTFIFPSSVLEGGESIKVGGYDSKAVVDFVWEEGRGIWNNSASDPAELYDAKGSLISRFND